MSHNCKPSADEMQGASRFAQIFAVTYLKQPIKSLISTPLILSFLGIIILHLELKPLSASPLLIPVRQYLLHRRLPIKSLTGDFLPCKIRLKISSLCKAINFITFSLNFVCALAFMHLHECSKT